MGEGKAMLRDMKFQYVGHIIIHIGNIKILQVTEP